MTVSIAVYNFLNFTQPHLSILGLFPLLLEFCTENPWLFLYLEAFTQLLSSSSDIIVFDRTDLIRYI